MPFADEYVVSAHPPLPLHSKVPRPWALDTYSTVYTELFKTEVKHARTGRKRETKQTYVIDY